LQYLGKNIVENYEKKKKVKCQDCQVYNKIERREKFSLNYRFSVGQK